MVGERGFEPPTPWSRTRCSTRLSHSPTRTARRIPAHCTKSNHCLRITKTPHHEYSRRLSSSDCLNRGALRSGGAQSARRRQQTSLNAYFPAEDYPLIHIILVKRQVSRHDPARTHIPVVQPINTYASEAWAGCALRPGWPSLR
jgi:hypothetical protein